MLPKRKLIKKQYTAPETSLTSEPLALSSENLLQQLQSTDSRIKSDAISAIANLNVLTSDLQEQLFSASSLMEIIKILTSNEPALVQITLFAINNMCTIQTESQSRSKSQIVKSLFQFGLDSALIKVNSADANLIKPILLLMGNIAQDIPAKYMYLLQGIQNTIITNNQKYLKLQPYYDLVLQFLMKSSYMLPVQSLTPGSITAQQINFIKILQNIAQTDKMYKNRAIAGRVLIGMTAGKAKQCVQIFFNNFVQLMQDIDLEKQYQINYQQIKKEMDQQLQMQEDFQEQQQQHNMMQQQKNVKNKNKNKKGQQENMQNKNKNKQKQPEAETPYTLFIDSLEGIQAMLEFIVDKLEDENNFNDQDQQEEEEDDMDQQYNQKEPIPAQFNHQLFLAGLYTSLAKIVNQLQKFTSFSFVEGQNLIQLLLRLILALPQNFSKTQQSNITTINLIKLTEQILIHQFKFQIKYPKSIPQQVFIYNFKTCLQVVLKYKQIINRNIYIQLPYLKYQSKGMSKTEERILKINNKWKQCWINLLQIYSLFFNPQKVAGVNQNQNKNIGGILKQLILQIPQIQLQQWRGQAIDTIFDVYSNENFDRIFMQYGFVQILTQVLKVATTANNKFGKKSKKSSKFITAVLSDIQRFIAYKKKMIGF